MAMFDFLPADYKAPRSAGNFMKLQDGENKFRILSAPIIGWEDWTEDNKPVRFRYHEKPKAPMNPDKKIKHFWAFVVWNYTEGKIQILQITQKSVQDCLATLSKDRDWGAPYFYDVKVSRSGEGINTKYSVVSLPHKPVADYIKEAFYENRCNLEALFSGEDPFAPSDVYADGVFQDIEPSCSRIDLSDLKKRFEMTSEAFQSQISVFLKKNRLKQDFSDMNDDFLERIDKRIAEELEKQAVGTT